MKNTLGLLALLVSAVLAAPAAAAATGPIGISSDGHIFVQDGQPLKILGDTGWFIFSRKGSPTVKSWLTTRHNQGFTAVMLAATGNTIYDPRVYSGPFAGRTDITKPNPAYWNELKGCIDHASSQKITVFMTPGWFALDGSGWFDTLAAKSDADLLNYGSYLGRQFNSCKNLIWILGGDGYKSLSTAERAQADRIIIKLAQGIRSTDNSKLISFHPPANTSSTQISNIGSIMDFHMFQDPGGEEFGSLLRSGYTRTPAKPIVMAETCYEERAPDGSKTYPLCKVRQLTISGWFYTALGTIYGHSSVFNASNMSKMNSRGAQQMSYVSRLMDEQQWSTLRPDVNGMVASGGLCLTNSTTSATRALIYTSGTGKRSVTVKQAMFRGTVQAQWWSPSTGAYSAAGLDSASTSSDRIFSIILGSTVDGPYDDRILVVTTGGTPPPPTDTMAPSTPAGLAAPVKSVSTIQLTWSASTDNVGVVGYDIRRSDSATVTTVTSPTFTATGLAANTNYTFSVSARDAARNSSAASTITAKTLAISDIVAPTVPTNLRATILSSSSIALTWTASTDAGGVIGYDVRRSDITTVTRVTSPNFTATGLAANTNYTFTVTARDAANNTAAASSVSGKTLATSGFVMGINMRGDAVTIGGNAWRSYSAALTQGLSITAPTGSSVLFATSTLTPSPAVDAATSAMLNTVAWAPSSFTVNQTLPNGTYNVYLWIMENYANNFRKINVSMENISAATGIGQLNVSSWQKYGPYPVVMTDGTLNITMTASQGNPGLMGLEIYRVSSSSAIASLSDPLPLVLGTWQIHSTKLK